MLLKYVETFCGPVQLMDVPSILCHLELLTEGNESRREADMENVTGAAISMWSLSFSTQVRFLDCTLCNKTSTQKVAQAQSSSHSQILAAPEFTTSRQLLCLHTARESLHEKHLLSCCLISEHHQLLNTLRVFPRCFLQVSLCIRH